MSQNPTMWAGKPGSTSDYLAIVLVAERDRAIRRKTVLDTIAIIFVLAILVAVVAVGFILLTRA